MSEASQIPYGIIVKDAELSKLFHGEKMLEGNFFSKITSKNKEAHKEVVNGYLNFWQKKDPMSDTEQEKNERTENCMTLTNSYYNIATDFYEYGWCDSFHFCRFYRGENFSHGISRHEHYLAMQLNPKPGMKILDIGCGVGGPAREICRFTDAHITGLNNNDYQVQRALQYAKKAGLESKTDFIKGNFMEMTFDDNSFDAVYAIEATCHAPQLERVYSEAFRVLKPGGKFAIYEWSLTNNYDPENDEHRKAVRGIEATEQAFKNVGFEIETAVDLAQNDDKAKWYGPLEGDFRKVQTVWDCFTVFRMSILGKIFTRAMVGFLEKIGVAPVGSLQTQMVLETAQNSLIAGGQMGIFTPMFMLVGRKPVSI
ncbi:5518_t:CDS:2 [Ambispora gerdemannii]|uniref:Sterol 24-C-methyltransferase n=1 Tax=Ambispora gerdemannii TaxID=144530 RepID=A0A9N9A3N1_9GLOM|nr:5518_t:CDS:2 [Ambispora gerdemannii]